MKTIFFILITVLTVGCTITKRNHLGGYHISWNKQYFKSKENSCELNAELPKYANINQFTRDSNRLVISENAYEQDSSLIISSSIVTTPAITTAQKVPVEKTFLIPLSPAIKEKHHTNSCAQVRPIYVSDQQLEMMEKTGWILFGIGLFLLLCVLSALIPQVASASTLWQIIIYILFALIGLLLIYLFGMLGAFIFSLSVALCGLTLALIAKILLKRRLRIYDEFK